MRDNPMHTTGKIDCITYYKLDVGGRNIYLWDYYNSFLIIGGRDRMADVKATLNIPHVAMPFQAPSEQLEEIMDT